MGFSWFGLGGKIGGNEYPSLIRPVCHRKKKNDYDETGLDNRLRVILNF